MDTLFRGVRWIAPRDLDVFKILLEYTAFR